MAVKRIVLNTVLIFDMAKSILFSQSKNVLLRSDKILVSEYPALYLSKICLHIQPFNYSTQFNY